MEVKVYDHSSATAYLELLAYYRLQPDIYYLPGYLEVDALLQKGTYEIYTIVSGNNLFIYPYIKLALDNRPGFFDLTSPYGYCGPYCTSAELLAKAEQEFCAYAIKNGFVSEFVRYHYQYNQTFKFTRNVQNSHNRTIVTLDLNKEWQQIWEKEMSGTNRNICRKLEKEGYVFELLDPTRYLPEFIELYEQTMKHASASDFYYFDRDVYFALFEQLGQKVMLTRVARNNQTYAMALFFNSGAFFTYYLSARNLSTAQVPATNLLLTRAAELAKKMGCEILNFGGGRSLSEDEPLYRFKCNFSRDRMPFYIGKRIHNENIYRELQQEYIAAKGAEQFERVKNILHFYRM